MQMIYRIILSLLLALQLSLAGAVPSQAHVNLKFTDCAMEANGKSWAEVVSVKIEQTALKAYNLTVADFHTYFVRGAANDNAQAVWVHNDCFNQQTGTFDNPPGHKRPGEIESGRRLQDELGIDVLPMDAQNGPDFVDVNGKTYDAMGMSNAYSNWGDGSGFLNSIDKHLLKSADNIVIDLAGSSSGQRQQILDHAYNSLNRPNGGSWVAEMGQGPSNPTHATVVDGLTPSGGVRIRAPWDQTTYTMTRDDFLDNWTGGFVDQ